MISRCTVKAHWSVTTKGVHDGANFNYVMKADSRVKGPWIDSEYTDPPVLTRQLVHL